ncbi:two-component system regulatory protein YycI [Dethiobacter alkaliphilus]|uniref:Regulatory protein YycH-like domain-containing protein n=1 Tax=Dethiobacter alkaliphilus AHT 1 TaxID=555088 RepID=C0GIA5_DETAL|nr:two-component system regulatory protein YycI [Dethiobacter alkaliphilus]EEG76953.1 hypothetical protein DealDRAFT_2214 [Dethiobacter alkaliphilus AHT 1]
MDLSRAKTILIIAFLLLNIFLGYRLWYTPQFLQAGQVITSEEVEAARQLLREHGYELQAAIPREVPRLALLHVSREAKPPSAWAKLLLDEEVPGVVTETGSIKFQSGEASVEVAPNGQVIYRRDKTGAASGDTSPQTADSFLRERQLWYDDLTLDAQQPLGTQEGSRISYVQTHQGFPIFFSTIDVFIADGFVYGANFYRVNPLSFSEQEVQVISAAEAMEAFIEISADSGENKITDISLGYFSAEYDAERWEIVPVWRITADDGSALYINAFTGEAEASAL